MILQSCCSRKVFPQGPTQPDQMLFVYKKIVSNTLTPFTYYGMLDNLDNRWRCHQPVCHLLLAKTNFNWWLHAAYQQEIYTFLLSSGCGVFKFLFFTSKQFSFSFGLYCLSVGRIVQSMCWHLVCLLMSPLLMSGNILRARMCAGEILGIALDFTCQWPGFYLSSPGEISGWKQIKSLALANKIQGSA